MEKEILFWQPGRKLTKAFVAQVRRRIERRQRWLNFWAGIRLALAAGIGLLGLAMLIWLIKDLYLNGFFLTLIRPDLYFSLTGLNLAMELIPWENLILLIASFWLVELLVKNRLGRSNG